MYVKQQLLTASRIATYLACQRRHYYRYEIGLTDENPSDALRFGTAWHKAMELRATGMSYDDTMEAIAPDLNGLPFVQLAAMLAGYWREYENDYTVLLNEEEFTHSIEGIRAFRAAGKLDKIVELPNGRHALMEHKTTAQSIAPDSDYWLQMRNSVQNYQYAGAAIRAGWQLSSIIYDVVRKPTINPRESVPVLDEEGRRVIVDANGDRLLKANGEPYATMPKSGGTALTQAETLEDYAQRLVQDTMDRPEFYYARREVPILIDDVLAFEQQRQEAAKEILYKRQRARKFPERPGEFAWLKNVSQMNCQSCQFSGICLNNISVDPENPPAGFVVGERHPELEIA